MKNENLTLTWQDALIQMRLVYPAVSLTFDTNDLNQDYVKVNFGRTFRTLLFKDSIGSLLLKSEVDKIKNELRHYSERV